MGAASNWPVLLVLALGFALTGGLAWIYFLLGSLSLFSVSNEQE